MATHHSSPVKRRPWFGSVNLERISPWLGVITPGDIDTGRVNNNNLCRVASATRVNIVENKTQIAALGDQYAAALFLTLQILSY